ncbi:hypothetical protein V1514DRAFT_290525 [Lipomyces japonicus]|uniref:uncharacterized protein n=1 Tax=Lipomyces japonicus TaxID=56871 RepID=UPI0034CD64B1
MSQNDSSQRKSKDYDVASGSKSLYEGIDIDSSAVSSSPATNEVTQRDKEQSEDASKKQMFSAALQFQPIIRQRPQSAIKKTVTATIVKPPVLRPTIANVEEFKASEIKDESTVTFTSKPHKRRRRKNEKEDLKPVDWEDSYDPMRPNSYEDYQKSEEKYAEDEDWRDFLIDLQNKTRSRSTQLSDRSSDSGNDENRNEAPARRSAMIFTKSQTHEEDNKTNSAHISREPIVYAQAQQGQNPDVNVKDDEPSLNGPTRPDRSTFAKRLLSKYGWTPGTGLGASSEGITKALHFSADKKQKGFGKIIDKNTKQEDQSRYGKMSKVIILQGIVNTGEVDEGLAGEIGEECSEKYGQVERVYIRELDEDIDVYVKFTSEISALRAVNGLDRRLFGGNALIPRYYDETDFENAIYLDLRRQ